MMSGSECRSVTTLRRLVITALLGVIILRSNAANAKAVLEGLDDPHRVPNQFIVTLSDRLNWSLEPGQFRSMDGLSAKEAAQQAAALDHDCKLAGSIAAELSKSHKVLAVHCLGHKGFIIQMTDDDARKMAEDPRVSVISADSPMYLTTVQTPAPWDLNRISQRALPLPLEKTYTYFAKGSRQGCAAVSAVVLS